MYFQSWYVSRPILSASTSRVSWRNILGVVLPLQMWKIFISQHSTPSQVSASCSSKLCYLVVSGNTQTLQGMYPRLTIMIAYFLWGIVTFTLNRKSYFKMKLAILVIACMVPLSFFFHVVSHHEKSWWLLKNNEVSWRTMKYTQKSYRNRHDVSWTPMEKSVRTSWTIMKDSIIKNCCFLIRYFMCLPSALSWSIDVYEKGYRRQSKAQAYIPKRRTLIQVLPRCKFFCYLLMHICILPENWNQALNAYTKSICIECLIAILGLNA